MASFDELLNRTKRSINSQKIKVAVLSKIHSYKDRYSMYSFFLPFGQHLHRDYPSFTPFYENLQTNDKYNISNDSMLVHNLINDMTHHYEKGDNRMYKLLTTFLDKF